jgi:hypothetical protein
MTARNDETVSGRTAKLLVSAACIAMAIMIAVDRGFYVRIANDIFFSVLLASPAIVFFTSGRGGKSGSSPPSLALWSRYRCGRFTCRCD